MWAIWAPTPLTLSTNSRCASLPCKLLFCSCHQHAVIWGSDRARQSLPSQQATALAMYTGFERACQVLNEPFK